MFKLSCSHRFDDQPPTLCIQLPKKLMQKTVTRLRQLGVNDYDYSFTGDCVELYLNPDDEIRAHIIKSLS